LRKLRQKVKWRVRRMSADSKQVLYDMDPI